jgi:hypothetical protein
MWGETSLLHRSAKPRNHSYRLGFCQDFFLAAKTLPYTTISGRVDTFCSPRSLGSLVMITGFNTDVKYANIVYHVQTEDKGLNNPVIESLIYVKGAILDSFRTRYQDFLDSSAFSESLLQKILEFQHHQIVSSIRLGKYQKGMRLEAYVAGDFVFELQSEQNRNPKAAPESPRPSPATPVEPSTVVPAAKPNVEPRSETSQPKRTLPRPDAQVGVAPSHVGGKPAPAPAFTSVDISTLSGEQGIEICVEGSKEFLGGEQVDLLLHVRSRQTQIRIENVQVVIKIIGTTFSPRLYAGKTDKSGSLRMNFSLPTFAGGSAALIIQASTSVGNDEVKYLIKRRR